MSDGSDAESGAGGGKRPTVPERPGRGRTGARKEDRIANQLRQVYDEALREPIPEDMLKLLDQLDAPSEKAK
jgi:hypothetical protein